MTASKRSDRSGSTIRRATHADVPSLVALLADDPLGMQREDASDIEPYRRAFEEIHASDVNRIAVATDRDGKVIGCIQISTIAGLSHRGARRGLIEDLRVAPCARRQGLATALVAWAIDYASQRGCKMVELFMHRERAAARALYESLGFSQHHDGFRLMLRP